MFNCQNLNENNLIIFTRYPEPGKTKTRLIPALGAKGAATLQRQLTEHTITEVKKLLQEVTISIYYAGKNLELMQAWLGNAFNYYTQTGEDLGKRMKSAFSDSFELGFSHVVIIGIDCPDLNIALLQEAFSRLKNYDLILGEATDGGYYLIGLKRVIPELFQDIPWGTSQVLPLTKHLSEKLNLKTYFLPMLSDIDRPEDLPIWQKHQ
ncbi:MAG: TIGR04282 family arsenosugar biosynthesis glycosyltransferase [Cyanobacteria bacterium P01_G01_bin.49]